MLCGFYTVATCVSTCMTSGDQFDLSVPGSGTPFGIMLTGTFCGPPNAALTFFRVQLSCSLPLQYLLIKPCKANFLLSSLSYVLKNAHVPRFVQSPIFSHLPPRGLVKNIDKII